MLEAGQTVVHKLTKQNVLILEVGPKTKKVLGPQGWSEQEYLPRGMLRIRLADWRVMDVYEYEIEGVDVGGPRILLDQEGIA